ncbi:ABC transporter permease [Rhizobium ruizarguesonis]|uniref:ABC transporter permease subunit n=1 Tax=Rhizobium ruizarguesonis TaxID=2081791 RepID=A0AB38HVI3_9HYPH|nr:ABC transporter permease subunit [Rhizobium ruizarguesonis]NEI03399.1 ABC transporter permease subunit [Rhizobium ruizarguesonis]TBA35059.1 ABC transporter permease subunit [Rhizobium ruizarguesonis]TBC05480.1 ABC transporter permease subunit [Rhizobium ruizarguesonis]
MEFISLLLFSDEGWGDELLRGLGVTLALAFATAPLALVLSFLLAWGKNARSPIARWFAFGSTTVFRSLPELLTLVIIYYQLQLLIDWVVHFAFPNASISLNAFAAGVVALTLVFSALGSEVVRAAYQAVGKGQAEAAASLGLHRRQVFFLVVLPQMWRHCIPAFGNLWLILLKDTSLVSIIAVNDLVRYTNMAISTTKKPFFFYTVLALIYVVLALLSGIGQALLERRTALRGGRGR